MKISLAEARRIALAAQGFDEPRPTVPHTRRHLTRTLARTGLLQIDSVNVLTRMHYLPLFSRLGAYPRALLDTAAWGRKSERRLFEYWAHEASLLPQETQPLLRWRMAQADRGQGVWSHLRPFATELRPAAEVFLNRIRQEGALAASDFEGHKGSGGWWGWSEAKRALEWLFWTGRITTATRRASFERVYDLTERVLPVVILESSTPADADAHRALLEIAGRSLGVATVNDLRDYFRQSPDDAKAGVADLVDAGVLIPAVVEGWSHPAYLHRDAVRPRKLKAAALLAPFDPLIWERARTERLWAVRYRIEIYTPAHKREHGYYVLPFLLDQALVARVDLKSDRAAGVLRVQAAHSEPGAPAETGERLATELMQMAGWLGLDEVVVERRGDLAERLAGAVAAL